MKPLLQIHEWVPSRFTQFDVLTLHGFVPLHSLKSIKHKETFKDLSIVSYGKVETWMTVIYIDSYWYTGCIKKTDLKFLSISQKSY